MMKKNRRRMSGVVIGVFGITCLIFALAVGSFIKKDNDSAAKEQSEEEQGESADLEEIVVKEIPAEPSMEIQKEPAQTEADKKVQGKEEGEKSDSLNNSCRIVCFGASNTEGTGSDGETYPKILGEISGHEVLNYGVYAEGASTIAARQGGNRMHLLEGITIPADCSPVLIKPVNEDDNPEMLVVFGDAGINPCYIGGVEGRMEFSEELEGRCFIRSTPGEAVTVEAGEEIEFFAMHDRREDDILIIWSGTNDEPDTNTIYDVIKQQRKMIDYAENGKYVVIGYVKKEVMEQIDQINVIMEEEYGEHFLDIRTYLLENGLKDANMEATAEDLNAIKNGYLPPSLMADDAGHGKPEFNRIIAKLVYEKLKSLGYL